MEHLVNLDIVITTGKTANEAQFRTAVGAVVERIDRAELQPSIPGTAMVHTKTVGAADFVVLHIGHVFLDGASNGCLLCCSIAVPAGRVV